VLPAWAELVIILTWQGRRAAKTVPLSEAKAKLSSLLDSVEGRDEEIVITRHGRPAGVLVGFASEDDWFEYRLEHHPEFVRRVAEARAALRRGQGGSLEEVEK